MNPIDYLLYREQLTPDVTAIFYQSQTISYTRLMNGVRAGAEIIRALKESNELDLVVADIRISDPLDYWIATLACLHEGATSVAPGPASALPEHLRPNVLIAPTVANVPGIAHTLNWPSFNAMPRVSPGSPHKPDRCQAFARIFFTSGTTGTSKAVGYTFHEASERSLIRAAYLPNYPRALTMMPPHSSSGFQFSLKQWALGHALALDANVTDVVQAITRHQIEHLTASPNQLKVLVQELRLLKTGLQLRAITVLGGVMTQRLFDELRSLTDADIYTQYGATETGTCAIRQVQSHIDLSQFGTLCPGVLAEIVNDMGEPMPAGEEGLLRVKTPSMAGDYLIPEVMPNQGFYQGWFYPGDLAVQNPDTGGITIAGRANDVFNSGGSKINLLDIDDLLCAQDGVRDAASFIVFDQFDYPEIWAAVVANKDLDLKVLLQSASKELGPLRTPKRILPVQVIPRTYSGKAQRNLMSSKVIALLNTKDSPLFHVKHH